MDNIKMLIKVTTNYDVYDDFDSFLSYLYNIEKQHILNDCNLTELPKELEYIVEERVAGNFLQMNKSTVLSADDLNVVTSIKEGDTQVNFGDTSNESRLDALINTWINSNSNRERDIACCRKLKW